MIMLDALRADCAPGAGDSPHLRSLGLKPPPCRHWLHWYRASSSFTQAMACSAYTTACVGSLFTGLLPPEHGVRAFDVTSLSSEVRTLAEILVEAGYATCAMSDQPPVLQPMGLLRGFQTLVANEDEALAWWDSYQSIPRFLFLHLWDCHKPYGMPFGRAYRSGYGQIVEQWQAKLRSKGIAEPQTAEFLDEQQERQRVYAMQNAWEDRLGFKAGLETYLAGLTTFDSGRLRDLAAALGQRRMTVDTVFAILADHGEGRDALPSVAHDPRHEPGRRCDAHPALPAPARPAGADVLSASRSPRPTLRRRFWMRWGWKSSKRRHAQATTAARCCPCCAASSCRSARPMPRSQRTTTTPR